MQTGLVERQFIKLNLTSRAYQTKLSPLGGLARIVSPLAGSQRSCRPRLARARRRLIGASHRVGLLQYLQIFIHYLQCIGEQYSANGQRQVVYVHTDDMASTRDWKAMPPALDTNQPAIFFSVEAENQRPNPVTDRSSGVGPTPGIEP